MIKKTIFNILTTGLILCSCAAPNAPLEVVPSFEISRFLGTWYEIGGIPTAEQANCTGTTATYSLRSNGDVDVLNRCFEKSLTGPEITARGRAFIPNPAEPTKLKVEFFWPFAGDYQIMALDSDYQYAMIGTPTRKYLWVLSRSKELPEATWNSLIEKAQAQGYSLQAIVKTRQIE
jgi:apolipoprotein D and lipocalin family protein